MLLASLLSCLTGFLSLCTEILWVRIFSYTNQTTPQAFAFVLVFYLSGIAFGALLGKRFCNVYHNLWLISGAALVAASLTDLVGPFVYAQAAHGAHQTDTGAAFIFISALLKAIVFPIAHFLGTPLSCDYLGRKISRVYVANIVGATLGPIFVTYILLAFFTTQQAVILCAGLTCVTGAGCLFRQVQPIVLSSITAAMILFFTAFLSLNGNFLISNISVPLGKIKRIIENQYGIIVIYKANKDDVVFGANVYDGRTNLDPIANTNRINRLIILSALHDKPKKVLMIGLSIGSWLKLVTSFPNVEKIDVVEINPGYVQAIKQYPSQAQGIKDPRVNIVIDDGRRWLNNHPDNKYDLIIINATYYWRAYSNNLLSENFLHLVKNHMLANALLSYNATGSPDALKTATVVFNHAYLYENFVIAADFDWRKNLAKPQARAVLSQLKLDGKLLFPTNSRNIIEYYLNEPIRTLAEIESTLNRPAEVITDVNLITEYKYGRGL